MTTSFWLTRARVRLHVPAVALRELLLPDDNGRRAGAGHRLVWTLFADAPERERDFLWREADAGTFYILSRREPTDEHRLFELDPPKPFAPTLAAGDRLRFSLRANATVSKKTAADPRARGKKCDVVMDALHAIPKGERADARRDAMQTAGLRWLAEQGRRCGFSAGGDGAALGARVTAYRTLRVDHAGPTARFGVLDFEGELEVREPAIFVAALGDGFGRAKAFGNGLMLVRRA